MPSIRLDLPMVLDATQKHELARLVGRGYAEVMDADADLVTVSIHDLGAGSVWRCHEDGPPTPAALVFCDVRRGRSVPTRARLAQRLVDLCGDRLGLDPASVKVEFTQHDGDEMYHPHLDGFNQDWSAGERDD